MNEPLRFGVASLGECFAKGVAAFGVPEPMTLDLWARKHFYLSAESSYVEQSWSPWWFQRPIMACISCDDIREVDWRKSARTGYTKIILAGMGYTAHHKRRNQILWQPTDDDRDEFVKTELEPMLRDVRVMQDVFPAHLARHKDNTLQAKKFLGSILHLKGGKAAKNYRRISADTCWLDELDAFDSNIEKEGDPCTLAAKRAEGATFPKLVFGTTPKLKGFSNIEKREAMAEVFMRACIPCPSCGEYHPLTWGGKDEPHGFKWTDDNPETVRHLCPHCGTLISQADYLAIADANTGRYKTDDGVWLEVTDTTVIFHDADGDVIPTPKHVAFHVWSAYSPNVSWAGLVREFLSAIRESGEGKKEKLQTFTNTTLGEYWAEDFEKSDENELRNRAEPYRLGSCPMGCLYLLAGMDTQPNRIECTVWGYGVGMESWPVDHRIFWGNPDEDEIWAEVEDYLFTQEFPHAAGTRLKISASAIDTRGHNTHAVYAWVSKHQARNVYAIAGRSGREKAIRDGATKVDIDWRGRVRKHGLLLWWVGTNHAKDLIHGRLQIQRPGPGYVHFSNELSDEWFKQFTGEARTSRRTARGGTESAWVATRKRVEAIDCATYATWLSESIKVGPNRYGLANASRAWWEALEQKVQPATNDLFSSTPPKSAVEPVATQQTSQRERSRPSGRYTPRSAPTISW